MSWFYCHKPKCWEIYRNESVESQNRRAAIETSHVHADTQRKPDTGLWWEAQRNVDQVVPAEFVHPSTIDTSHFRYQVYARPPPIKCPESLRDVTDEPPPVRYNVKRIAVAKPYPPTEFQCAGHFSKKPFKMQTDKDCSKNNNTSQCSLTSSSPYRRKKMTPLPHAFHYCKPIVYREGDKNNHKNASQRNNQSTEQILGEDEVNSSMPMGDTDLYENDKKELNKNNSKSAIFSVSTIDPNQQESKQESRLPPLPSSKRKSRKPIVENTEIPEIIVGYYPHDKEKTKEIIALQSREHTPSRTNRRSMAAHSSNASPSKSPSWESPSRGMNSPFISKKKILKDPPRTRETLLCEPQDTLSKRFYIVEGETGEANGVCCSLPIGNKPRITQTSHDLNAQSSNTPCSTSDCTILALPSSDTLTLPRKSDSNSSSVGLSAAIQPHKENDTMPRIPNARGKDCIPKHSKKGRCSSAQQPRAGEESVASLMKNYNQNNESSGSLKQQHLYMMDIFGEMVVTDRTQNMISLIGNDFNVSNGNYIDCQHSTQIKEVFFHEHSSKYLPNTICINNNAFVGYNSEPSKYTLQCFPVRNCREIELNSCGEKRRHRMICQFRGRHHDMRPGESNNFFLEESKPGGPISKQPQDDKVKPKEYKCTAIPPCPHGRQVAGRDGGPLVVCEPVPPDEPQIGYGTYKIIGSIQNRKKPDPNIFENLRLPPDLEEYREFTRRCPNYMIGRCDRRNPLNETMMPSNKSSILMRGQGGNPFVFCRMPRRYLPPLFEPLKTNSDLDWDLPAFVNGKQG